LSPPEAGFPEDLSKLPSPYHRAIPGSSDFEWLSQKIDYLRAIAGPARGILRETVYEAGSWAVLKLVTLLHVHDIYLRIMANQRREKNWEKLFYIDLNAATGLVQIEDTRTVVAGSAIVGADTWRRGVANSYDHFVFVEPNPQWAKALQARLIRWLPRDRFTVFEEGADTAVPKIVDLLSMSKSHYLSVFDPFAFQEGSWASYGKLLESTNRGDMVITFQTTMVKRSTPKIIGKFFGPHVPEYRDSSEDRILALFRDHLRPFREVVESVKVRAGGAHGRYYYDLIYAVARTRRQNPFMQGIIDLRSRIERLSGQQIDRMIGYRTLDRFDTSLA
jgi:three-Cys-motif partner protein